MSSTVEAIRCEGVLDRVEAFIDDDLDIGERRSIEDHLAHCEACSEELDHAIEAVAALRALPELDAPDRVIENALAVIARHDPTATSSPHRRRRRRWLAAAAAVLIGIVGAAAVVRERAETTNTEALRAAADVRLALSTMYEISERANRIVQARIIDNGPIPLSLQQFVRSLKPLTSLQTTDGPLATPDQPPHEGSS